MKHQLLLKIRNKKNILTEILDNPMISRADIARKCRLSKTTVSSLVDELIQEEYIQDNGIYLSSKLGRNPNKLCINNNTYKFIILNCRKKNLEIASINLDFSVDVIKSYKYFDERKNIVDEIEYYFNEHIEKINKEYILGVCLVIPGIIDINRREINSVILSRKIDSDYYERLYSIFKDYNFEIINDTAALAYAENIFGDIDSDNYVYVNINDGIGAAYIKDKKIINGEQGADIQFGHFCIDPHGEECKCGNRGCLENRVGESALENIAKRLDVCDIFSDDLSYDFEHLSKYLLEGKKGADKIIESMSDDLSYALGNYVTMCRTDSIIIGGKGKKLGEIFIDALRKKIKYIGYRDFVENINIYYTSLDDSGIYVGAARFLYDESVLMEV